MTTDENKEKIRTFETGATRDTDTNKLDFEGFLSYPVLLRYAEYMNKHRIQPDGKLRESDNWQKLFGENHYDICMKSMFRHFMDVWAEHRGFESRDGIEDALCAVIFNAMAYLHKILKEKQKKTDEKHEISVIYPK